MFDLKEKNGSCLNFSDNLIFADKVNAVNLANLRRFVSLNWLFKERLNVKDYTDFFKIIKDLIMEAAKLSTWRFLAILITLILCILAWKSPEILTVMLK